MKTKCYLLILLALFLVSTNKVASQDTKPQQTTTTFSAIILVNTEFKYQVTIKTLIAVQPTGYKLVKFPEGMTIDEKTGVISWTPKTKGEFVTEAVAYLNTSVIGSSIIKIKVVEALGSVKGVVKSSEDKLLQYAYITLYKKIVIAGKPDSYNAAYSGSTDQNGTYNIPNVELGTYIAYAMAKSTEANVFYQSIYYVDATSADKATSFTVGSNSPAEINFKLPKITVTPSVFTNYSAVLKVGTEFKYQVEVKLPAGVTSAVYRLTARPEGMTIDEKTGLVKWTPKTKGDYGAQVTVTAGEQKLAVINMKLTVYSFRGSLAGTVVNEENKPLQYVTISLLRKVSSTEKGTTFANSFSALTDAEGKYTFANVDSAIYYVYAKGGYEKSPISSVLPVIYKPVYYDNAETIDKATAVPVVSSSPVVINFILKKYVKPEPAKAFLSGIVTDASGKAIVGARILVSQTKPASTNNSMMDGMNFLVSNNASVSSYADVLADSKTDANGKYSISLISGNSYIVSCMAEGFLQQYYNGKSSVLDANKILLRRDTTGIDFKLIAAPVAKAIISGVVVDNSNAPVISKVVLYPATATLVANKGIRSSATNEKGEFIFEKVPNGKYYLQVIPLKDFIPAYYKMNDCGVREVKLADVITIENDANITNISVCVKKAKLNGGGKISGYVKNYYGEPVGGVIIIAEGSAGNDLSFDISDTDGSYAIESLGADVYSVYSDKAGYTSSFTNNAVIDYQKNAFNSQVDLIVDAPVITDVKRDNGIPANFELMQNYPNPFNPSTMISYKVQAASHVTLKVFDMLGREPATLVDEFKQPGVYNNPFSIQNSSLSSGVYYYTLKAGNFIQTKKMVLTK